MSDLLGIGASGVSAYRAALGVVGDNVVNSQTKGYVRRDVALSELTPNGGSADPIYQKIGSGSGVRADAVIRAADQFRAADSRLTSADAGRSDARLRWLSTVETSLTDGGVGLGTKLTAIFTAGDQLAADPNGTLPRRQMLLAMEDGARAIRTTAASLVNASKGVAEEAGATVDVINSDLKALANVNQALLRSGEGTTARAKLEDERDRLLDDLADKIGIDTSFDRHGAAKVTLSGAPGITLLDGTTPTLVEMTTATDGRLSFVAHRSGDATVAVPMSGALAGLADVASNIAGRRQQLDQIATDFATAMNSWSANGTDQNGQPGDKLFSETGGAAGLTVLVTDPRLIPAADDDSANGNLIALSDLRGSNGVESRTAALLVGHSQIVAAAKSEDAAAATRRDNAFAARDAISGVDLDREAAELIRFQQAYDGSAKIIQAARETLQSILALF